MKRFGLLSGSILWALVFLLLPGRAPGKARQIGCGSWTGSMPIRN